MKNEQKVCQEKEVWASVFVGEVFLQGNGGGDVSAFKAEVVVGMGVMWM